MGVVYFSPTIRSWLEPSSLVTAPTLGSFLYVLLGSLAAGLIISALRWATLDTFHHATGLAAPALNFATLPQNLEAFILGWLRRITASTNSTATPLWHSIAAVCRLTAIGNLGGTGPWRQQGNAHRRSIAGGFSRFAASLLHPSSGLAR